VPEVTNPTLATIQLVSGLVGAAHSVGHDRKPGEAIDFAISCIKRCADAGVTSIGDIMLILGAVKPIITNGTEEQ
jgi:hypothetical protein